ncbi:MAG: tetratricopeptide repeat protein, partial [Acidobacteria bacterium]|nr:tetratricopeptide repeat protein [Acidobacteriota bacterium]
MSRRMRMKTSFPVYIFLFTIPFFFSRILPALHGASPTQEQHQPPQVSEALAEGYRLLEEKDYAGAELSFRRALGTGTRTGAAHRGLGRALWSQGFLESSEHSLERAVDLEPSDAAVQMDLARLRDDLSRSASTPGRRETYRQEAEASYRQVLELEPDNLKARLRLGNLLLESRRVPEAVREAENAARLAPGNVKARLLLARAHQLKGDWGRAEVQFKEVLALQPNHTQALVGLGEVLRERGDLTAAAERLQAAVRAQPGLWEAHRALGEVHLLAKRSPEAVRAFTRAVELEPRDWQSRFHLGMLLRDRGRLPEATEHLEQVIAAKPNHLAAYEELGYVL